MQERGTAAARTVVDVLTDIGRTVQDLVRSEIRLAQVEIRERLFGAHIGALICVGLGALFLCGFFLLLALLFALRLLLPAWEAALILAAALAATGALALSAGLHRLKKTRPVLKPLDK
jgi:uncharacterized membrane protein YqjE